MDNDALDEAVSGHDAVIVCLGSTGLRDKTTLATGTTAVVDEYEGRTHPSS